MPGPPFEQSHKHTQQSGVCFWVFYLLCRKKKKNGTARFFPRPALGWAGLNFFVQKFFILILAPTLLSIQFLVVVF